MKVPGVSVGQALGSAFRVKRHEGIKWKYTRIGATVVSWCPLCGVLLAGRDGERAHSLAHDEADRMFDYERVSEQAGQLELEAADDDEDQAQEVTE